MANVTLMPSFYPRRLSQYVGGMTYAADLQIGGDMRISFLNPIVATAAQFISAQSTAAAGTLQAASLLNSATIDAPFGRNLTFVLSGAGAGTVTVDGFDYLNQAMSESGAMNGATPVVMLKAFKIIRQVTWTLVAATTFNLGVGSQLGLPYRAIRVFTEENNSTPATLGTLTSPVLTDPATITTGDTRGTYLANTTLNGVNVVTASFAFANDVNAAGNGGLFGLPHFAN